MKIWIEGSGEPWKTLLKVDFFDLEKALKARKGYFWDRIMKLHS